LNVNLNLASKPFNNRVLPWMLTAVILMVSFVGLIIVFQLTTSTRRESNAIQVELNALKQKEQGLLTKAEQVKDALGTDQQQSLKAAHQLVDRKRFSWSRLLSDLESAMPDNVRVSRIAVREVSSQGGQTVAVLDLTVFSKGYESVDGMIKEMDRNGTFRADIMSQNLQKGRGEIGTEYDLAVVYRPRASFASESVAELNDQTKTSGEKK
jgi:Tfp pilus assembly protein PilN